MNHEEAGLDLDPRDFVASCHDWLLILDGVLISEFA